MSAVRRPSGSWRAVFKGSSVLPSKPRRRYRGEVLIVACPYCAASPDEPCRSFKVGANEQPRNCARSHNERFDAARAASNITRAVAAAAAAAEPVAPCPNCTSDTHARCCARCGHVMNGLRKRDSFQFCSVACERAQQTEDRISMRIEEAEQRARVHPASHKEEA